MISEDFLKIKADSAAKFLEAGIVGFLKTRIYQALEKTYREQVENVSWSSELRELQEKQAKLEVLIEFASNLGYTPNAYINELLSLEKEIYILDYGEEGFESMKQGYLSEVFQEQASDNERLGIA